MQDHRKLRVWQLARQLALDTYRTTEFLPDAERFGLSHQMRRASVSIASNIAEGASRTTPKEFARFLVVALGSLAELDTQATIAADLGYLASNQHEKLTAPIDQLRPQLISLHKAVLGTIGKNPQPKTQDTEPVKE